MPFRNQLILNYPLKDNIKLFCYWVLNQLNMEKLLSQFWHHGTQAINENWQSKNWKDNAFLHIRASFTSFHILITNLITLINSIRLLVQWFSKQHAGFGILEMAGKSGLYSSGNGRRISIFNFFTDAKYYLIAFQMSKFICIS